MTSELILKPAKHLVFLVRWLRESQLLNKTKLLILSLPNYVTLANFVKCTSIFPFLFLLPTSNPLANFVSFSIRVYPKFHHSFPPLLPWSKPTSSLSWIIAIASQMPLCFYSCHSVFYSVNIVVLCKSKSGHANLLS